MLTSRSANQRCSSAEVLRVEVLIFNAPESVDFLPDEAALLVDPTPAQMVALLRRGTEYWGTGSGGGALHWSKAKMRASGGMAYQILQKRPSLSILFHDGVGFHFGFSTGKGEQFLVPFDSSTSDERIKHYLGGNQAFFPVRTFVPLKVAERIVKDFIKTEKASSVVEWESGAKLRCGDPDG
jgi:hypothetical protein